MTLSDESVISILPLIVDDALYRISPLYENVQISDQPNP